MVTSARRRTNQVEYNSTVPRHCQSRNDGLHLQDQDQDINELIVSSRSPHAPRGVGGALACMELVGLPIRLSAIAFYTVQPRLLPTLW